jgi:membrane protein DedA with SNARE-associated domain
MHLWILILAIIVALPVSFGTGFLIGKRFGTAACTNVWSKKVTHLTESVAELRTQIKELQGRRSRV